MVWGTVIHVETLKGQNVGQRARFCPVYGSGTGNSATKPLICTAHVVQAINADFAPHVHLSEGNNLPVDLPRWLLSLRDIPCAEAAALRHAPGLPAMWFEVTLFGQVSSLPSAPTG